MKISVRVGTGCHFRPSRFVDFKTHFDPYATRDPPSLFTTKYLFQLFLFFVVGDDYVVVSSSSTHTTLTPKAMKLRLTIIDRTEGSAETRYHTVDSVEQAYKLAMEDYSYCHDEAHIIMDDGTVQPLDEKAYWDAVYQGDDLPF